MAQSTLEMIQAIEDKAAKIDASYHDQIEQLKEEQELRLEAATKEEQQNCEKQFEITEKKLQEELKQAQEELKQTKEQFQRRTEEVMTQKKDALVDYIIQEVVKKYGY